MLVSIGWKVAAYSQAFDSSESTQKIAGFLTRQHFTIADAGEMPGGTQMMRATARACSMIVALSSPRGWDRDMIRRLATPTDHTFVVFRGRIYSEQPMWLTVADFLWSRVLGELGMKADAAPVIAVTAANNCEAERLPWNELG
jgi:hypothetical protein